MCRFAPSRPVCEDCFDSLRKIPALHKWVVFLQFGAMLSASGRITSDLKQVDAVAELTHAQE